MKYNSILETIGKTPMIKINRLFETANKKNIQIYMKMEKSNPSASIKDRIALAMIEDAEEKGLIKKGSIIVEPTSGNTGVGLAMVCAVKGYELIITMPDSMSLERRKLMSAFGAKLELTPRAGGMNAAIAKAKEIVANTPNAWMPMQFENFSNLEIHKKTTALEIKNDLDKLDYVIAGVGTGGHIGACGEILKPHFKNLKVIAVEPSDSPVLSGGKPGPHALQGLGAGFIPKILNVELLDKVVTITKEEAFQFAQALARQEGILAGISTGANLAAVSKLVDEMPEGSTVVTFNYDTGERYLSVEGLY